MACHVFALSANFSNISTIHGKYNNLGDYLSGITPPPLALQTPRLMNAIAFCAPILGGGAVNHVQLKATVMDVLCERFNINIAMQAHGTGTQLHGLIRPGDMLPEHMWITHNGWIFDTMPGFPILKELANANNSNPQCEANLVNPVNIASVPIAGLTPSQATIIITMANLNNPPIANNGHHPSVWY